MIAEHDFKRIRWASRRGMLELDLILVPFVEQRFRELDEENQQRYVTMLEGEDNDMFAWLLERDKPEDPDLVIIVNEIVAFHKANI